jgi:hypothetical protein
VSGDKVSVTTSRARGGGAQLLLEECSPVPALSSARKSSKAFSSLRSASPFSAFDTVLMAFLAVSAAKQILVRPVEIGYRCSPGENDF